MNKTLFIIGWISRQFIYSYYFRYISYAINFIIETFKLNLFLKNKWIIIGDYDRDLAIKINPTDHIGQRIFFKGYYEGLEIGVLRKLFKLDWTVIDIGANIGTHSLIYSKLLSKGSVYSFEPSAYFNLLEQNILINPELNNIYSFNLALGERNEKKFIHQSISVNELFESNIGTNRLISEKKSESDKIVEVIKLDDWIKENNIKKIDFIKLDVEGMEMDVLKGSLFTLIKHKPLLLIEFDEKNLLSYNASVKKVVDLLKSIGYRFFYKASKRYRLSAIDFNELYADPKAVNVFCSETSIRINGLPLPEYN